MERKKRHRISTTICARCGNRSRQFTKVEKIIARLFVKKEDLLHYDSEFNKFFCNLCVAALESLQESRKAQLLQSIIKNEPTCATCSKRIRLGGVLCIYKSCLTCCVEQTCVQLDRLKTDAIIYTESLFLTLLCPVQKHKRQLYIQFPWIKECFKQAQKSCQALINFNYHIQIFPSVVCLCCFTYKRNTPDQVKIYRIDEVLYNLLELNHTVNPARRITSGLFCHYCYEFIRKSKYEKLPPRSITNHLQLYDPPSTLHGLTFVERRLISRVQPFYKLQILPLGQRAIRGIGVNVPVDVCEVVKQLPDLSSTNILLMALPRPEDNLDTPGATQQLTYPVRTRRIIDALKTLKACNPFYKDIIIRHEEYPEIYFGPEPEWITHLKVKLHVLQAQPEENTAKDNRCTESSQINGSDINTAIDDLALVDIQFEDIGITSYDPHMISQATTNETLQMVTLEMVSTVPSLEEDLAAYQEQFHKSPDVQPLAPFPKANRICSVFTEPEAEVMMFPTVFWNGISHRGTVRNFKWGKLSAIEYFQSRLTCPYRHRLLLNNDLSYLFYASNTADMVQMSSAIDVLLRMRNRSSIKSQGNVSVSTHSHAPDVDLLTAGMLQDAQRGLNPDIDEKCFRFMKNIRGTYAYWKEERSKLYSLIKMLGVPTFFMTLSADDMHWEDSFMAAGKITKEQLDTLDNASKQRLLFDKPDLVAEHFDHKFRYFLHHFLKGPSMPLGRILDYWYRIEFQMRGSPHVHMLLWIEGAPDVDTDAGKIAAPSFIDKYICTRIPAANISEEQDQLRKLVKHVQQHTHKVRDCGADGKKCRYKFPRPLSQKTRFRSGNIRAERNLPKYHLFVTKRESGDQMTNAYNPAVLLAWKANMDIQLVCSIYKTVDYICSYITKAEEPKLQAEILGALNRLPDNATQRQRYSKIAYVLLSNRTISAQEAAWKILGLPYTGCSRSIVDVNNYRPNFRTRMLKTHREINELPPESTDIFRENILTRYAARPLGRLWESMDLATFATNFRSIQGARHDPETEPISATVPLLSPSTTVEKYRLRKPNLWIASVTKPQCIRVRYLTPEKHGDDYYYGLLLLYCPWRSEDELLSYGHSTNEQYTTAFEAFIAKLPASLLAKVQARDRFANDLECAVNRIRALNDQIEVDETLLDNNYSESMQPHNNFEPDNSFDLTRLLDTNMLQDVTLDGCVSSKPSNKSLSSGKKSTTLTEEEEIVAGVRASRFTESSAKLMTDQQYESLKSQLSPEQAIAFNTVVENSKSRHFASLNSTRPPPPLCLFISGGAGTGKSFVIKVIAEHVRRVTGQHTSSILMAPTGIAAFNIEGTTIHSTLKIPFSNSEMYKVCSPLPADQIADLKRRFRFVTTIIIDEVSMLSYRLLFHIHTRLNEIREIHDPDIKFGGYDIICIGDFYQLKPINQRFVFDDDKFMVNQTYHLWRDHFRMIELKVNQRQKKDLKWLALLNRLRIGQQTAEDIECLQERTKVPVNGDSAWINCVRLLSKRAECDAFNTLKLDSLRNRIYALRATHRQAAGSVTGAATSDVDDSLIPDKDEQCGGLVKELKVAVGARVMLRFNIDVEDGLVNGVCGTIRAIEFANGALENASVHYNSDQILPEAIYVQFDNAQVGHLTRLNYLHSPASDSMLRHAQEFAKQNCVPIVPLTTFFRGKSSKAISVSRTQFPLILCFAITIHKTQGLTLAQAVIDLGMSIFEEAQAYVALSRVQTLDGVALINFTHESLKTNAKVKTEYERLRQLNADKPSGENMWTHCRSTTEPLECVQATTSDSENIPTSVTPYDLAPSYLQTCRPTRYGINNIANNCYVNSIVQALAHSPGFIEWCDGSIQQFQYIRGEVEENTLAEMKRDSLLYQFLSLIQKLRTATKLPYADCSLFLSLFGIANPNFRVQEHAHNDAAEFLNEALAWITAGEDNPWDYHCGFHGSASLLCSTLACTECDFVQLPTEEKYLCWDIDFPQTPFDNSISSSYSLQQLLDTFFKVEHGIEYNGCKVCNPPNTSFLSQRSTLFKKQLRIKQLPQILIISLKRFEHNNQFQTTKIHSQIEFPLIDLNLGSYLHRTARNNVNNSYDCYAIVHHLGDTADSGHYTTTAWSYSEQSWLKFDDQVVSAVSEEEAAHPSKSAYILFYRRK